MDEDVSLLWEHSALTCHFNIMNNITLVFCIIHVTFVAVHARFKRDFTNMRYVPKSLELATTLLTHIKI